MSTPEAVEARSQERARANKIRVRVVAVFAFVLFITLASLLQIQQNQLHNYVRQMCLQRQINTQRSNQIWADLGVIEEHNKFIDAQIREERLRVYRNAHLDVPICT